MQIHRPFRELILAGAAFGVLSVVGCAIEAPTKEEPTVATATQAVIPAAGNPVEACPLHKEDLETICKSFNEGKDAHEKADYFLPRSIYVGEPLVICVCPDRQVTSCPPEPAEVCAIGQKKFVRVEQITSESFEGSHCERACTVDYGGGPTVEPVCLTNCRLNHPPE